MLSEVDRERGGGGGNESVHATQGQETQTCSKIDSGRRQVQKYKDNELLINRGRE